MKTGATSHPLFSSLLGELNNRITIGSVIDICHRTVKYVPHSLCYRSYRHEALGIYLPLGEGPCSQIDTSRNFHTVATMGIVTATDFTRVRTLVLDSPRSLLAIAISVLIVVPVVWVLADYVRILRLRQKMPPGPFPLPLVGNFFAIPKVKPWIEWEKWAEYYDNPMITIWNGHRPIIMCNDIWTISDLLDKRASIYSSRARMIVMGDCLNQTESNQVNLVYGDRWRLHRRLMVSLDG